MFSSRRSFRLLLLLWCDTRFKIAGDRKPRRRFDNRPGVNGTCARSRPAQSQTHTRRRDGYYFIVSPCPSHRGSYFGQYSGDKHRRRYIPGASGSRRTDRGLKGRGWKGRAERPLRRPSAPCLQRKHFITRANGSRQIIIIIVVIITTTIIRDGPRGVWERRGVHERRGRDNLSQSGDDRVHTE